ncbi:putative ribonuclease H-like domain-containing protein [Tanacetum coccineum]|uniref:Ribonuclease H-like domain-containing protein n=1 Tax=Tanacetum coccineum TaxID=301880 RepID=A0ABQ5HA31_9ASTR
MIGLGVDFEDESSEPSRSRGTDLEMDVNVVRIDGIKIDPEIQAEIDKCFAYADAFRDRGIDARVVVEAVDQEKSETGMRSSVEVRVERVTHPVMPEDTPEPAQDGAVEVVEEAQREQGHRIVGAEMAVIILIERVVELERDNKRLRGTASVESQKVDRLQHGMARMQRELRQIRHLNHLIRDCDFHEKRMARKAELNNGWNNVQRVNKQNQFVPSVVLIRTGKIPVSTARASISTVGGKRETAVKPSDYPHRALKNKGIIDYRCSRHMTGNKAYLAEFQDFNGGHVAFGGSKGYITGKGKIKTSKLDFEDVCFVKELQHFNLFSVSQICDKKNKVLFTDSECLVLSSEFKLPDENQVLLKIPRQNNMYNFNLENIIPTGGLACLIAKATTDESNKWHRRLGHVNFKNLNKLMKGNLVRGLPSNIFQNDHTCVACQKGKQHKASCKSKEVSSISQTLQLLHMDLFRPTSVRSLNHKTYCLVITDDFSRFSWVFFLRTKDETSAILKDFIRQIKNWKRLFKKRNKKKAKNKQIQAWSGKDKVKSQPSDENIT